MLCLYIDTLIIGHKFSNMLSILNELTLQKQLQNFVTNNVFLTKKQNTKSNIKSIDKAGNRVRDCSHPRRMRNHSAIESTESSHCIYLTVSTQWVET